MKAYSLYVLFVFYLFLHFMVYCFEYDQLSSVNDVKSKVEYTKPVDVKLSVTSDEIIPEHSKSDPEGHEIKPFLNNKINELETGGIHDSSLISDQITEKTILAEHFKTKNAFDGYKSTSFLPEFTNASVNQKYKFDDDNVTLQRRSYSQDDGISFNNNELNNIPMDSFMNYYIPENIKTIINNAKTKEDKTKAKMLLDNYKTLSQAFIQYIQSTKMPLTGPIKSLKIVAEHKKISPIPYNTTAGGLKTIKNIEEAQNNLNNNLIFNKSSMSQFKNIPTENGVLYNNGKMIANNRKNIETMSMVEDGKKKYTKERSYRKEYSSNNSPGYNSVKNINSSNVYEKGYESPDLLSEFIPDKNETKKLSKSTLVPADISEITSYKDTVTPRATIKLKSNEGNDTVPIMNKMKNINILHIKPGEDIINLRHNFHNQKIKDPAEGEYNYFNDKNSLQRKPIELRNMPHILPDTKLDWNKTHYSNLQFDKNAYNREDKLSLNLHGNYSTDLIYKKLHGMKLTDVGNVHGNITKADAIPAGSKVTPGLLMLVVSNPKAVFTTSSEFKLNRIPYESNKNRKLLKENVTKKRRTQSFMNYYLNPEHEIKPDDDLKFRILFNRNNLSNEDNNVYRYVINTNDDFNILDGVKNSNKIPTIITSKPHNNMKPINTLTIKQDASSNYNNLFRSQSHQYPNILNMKTDKTLSPHKYQHHMSMPNLILRTSYKSADNSIFQPDVNPEHKYETFKPRPIDDLSMISLPKSSSISPNFNKEKKLSIYKEDTWPADLTSTRRNNIYIQHKNPKYINILVHHLLNRLNKSVKSPKSIRKFIYPYNSDKNDNNYVHMTDLGTQNVEDIILDEIFNMKLIEDKTMREKYLNPKLEPQHNDLVSTILSNFDNILLNQTGSKININSYALGSNFANDLLFLNFRNIFQKFKEALFNQMFCIPLHSHEIVDVMQIFFTRLLVKLTKYFKFYPIIKRLAENVIEDMLNDKTVLGRKQCEYLGINYAPLQFVRS